MVDLRHYEIDGGDRRQNMSRVIEQLKSLGFSSQQAKIYLELSQRGELRIQEICGTTSIPRSSVYDAIETLEKKGLVEKIIGDSHVKISAYPLETLRNNLRQQAKELQALNEKLDKVERSLANSSREYTDQPTKVRYYRGKSGARQLFWNTLKAQDAVYVYSDWGRSKYIGPTFYERFVSESKQRHIKEQVLINPTSEKLAQIKTFEGSTTSRTYRTDIRAIDPKQIRISGETFIYNNIYAVIYLKHGELNGFEIESQDFVTMQRSVFKTLWDGVRSLDESTV